jgi:phosphopantothenoylcysteine decarboxylase/phosphopantothenate--cysteine ligase
MKNIYLGICGSLSCSAVPAFVLLLKSRYKEAVISVVQTENSKYFLAPGALQHIPNVKVIDSAAGDSGRPRFNHAEVVQGCELFIVLPATANFLGKAANGIADDLLTTCFIAYGGQKIIFPAMNEEMISSKYVLSNIERLRAFGDRVVTGGKAISVSSGDLGYGGLPDPRTFLEDVASHVTATAVAER